MYDSGVSAGPPLIRPQSWEQVFAWLPVHIHGKRKWMTKVWRRVHMVREDMTLYADYEYGNMFDVIKDEQ
jgi:uncharacterized membrane protein YfhO